MGFGIRGNVDKIVGIFRRYSDCGLTLAELIAISGMFSSDISAVFDELEDEGKLCVKSNGSLRIYNFEE